METPLPYVSTNPTGIGASVYGQAINMLDQQQQEDTGLTEALKDSIVTKEKKAEQNAKFLGGLNPDLGGIVPEDTPWFQGQTNELHELAKKAVAAGGDITNPQNPFYWPIQQKISDITSAAAMSVQQHKDYNDYGKEWILNPDKFSGDVGTNVATSRAAGNPILRNAKYGNIATLFTPKPQDFETIMGKHIKAMFPKETKNTTYTTEESGNEYVKRTTTENIPYDHLEDFANHIEQSPDAWKAAKFEWNDAKTNLPGMIQGLVQPHLDKGESQSQAETSAFHDFVHSKALSAYIKSDQDVPLGLTPQGKMRLASMYTASKAEQKAKDYTPQAVNLADLLNGKPGAEMAYKTWQGDPIERTVTLVTPQGVSQQKFSAPNAIESIIQSPSGGIDIVTTEDKLNQANNTVTLNNDGVMVPSITAGAAIKPTHFGKNDGFKLVQYLADKGVKSGDKDLMSGIYSAAIKKGAINSDGSFDPEKVAPSSMWKKPVAQSVKTNKVAVGNYKIGQVQGGYKYTGGDPTKPENWEKQ